MFTASYLTRRLVAVWIAAGALALVQPAAPVYGQTAPPDAAAAAAVNPNDLSCKELKSRLAKSGSLTLVVGPRGAGDTYYGRVPQCEFWQRPVFSYVNTSDGRCDVGFVCTAKISGN